MSEYPKLIRVFPDILVCVRSAEQEAELRRRDLRAVKAIVAAMVLALLGGLALLAAVVWKLGVA